MRVRLFTLVLLAGCTGEVLGSFDAARGSELDAASLADGAIVSASDAAAPKTDASRAEPDTGARPQLDGSSIPGDAALHEPDADVPQPDAGRGGDAGTLPGPDLWITAYIAGWNLNVPPNAAYGTMPGTAVDYSAFTHGILFALGVESDGTLCCIADWDTFAPDRIRSTISGGHAVHRPILFSIGGAGNTEFATAIATPGTRTTLVGEVVNVLSTYGFDGVDLDMEPIGLGDEAHYQRFVEELVPALAAKTTPLLPRPLLTAACGSGNAAMFASLAGSFDQINLMTYDMSGAWGGWVTWHNSPLFDGGYRFPSTNGPVPSANRMVDEMIAAGVPARKIGIGLDLYGYVWKGGAGTATGGVTAPRQEWTNAPTVESNVSYADILANYYQASRYHWDSQAEAAYLSIDDPSNANDRFVSYDDETTAQKKVDYVRTKGIGGMILWELGGAYLPSAPAGKRDPLLQAVRTAAGL
ncbi:MAG: glycoside hydrolase family 18 protein [Deltaproteobacteria bacterium]|nr:glycoside hydrolase family 18 protein [Deltaproteobacteria bacterium]